jgi:antitoxin component of MazEF toxin-antitoxin module
MQILRKLSVNGTSPSIAVPRPFQHHLGWQVGDSFVVQRNTDRSLLIRRPTARDAMSQIRPIPSTSSMICLRRLIINGRSHSIGLPKRFLADLDWCQGDMLVVQLLEDNSLWIRRPTQADMLQDYHAFPSTSAQPPVLV